MGDRVIVTFTTDDKTYTPGVYMHWHGSRAEGMIRAAQPLMRAGDDSYSAARFCGYCHTQIPGSLSLGLVDAPDGKNWTEYSHGDNGVYVVNVTTGKVSCYDGNNLGFQLDPKKFNQE